MDGGAAAAAAAAVDAFGSHTAPLRWHDFLERMRHPSAADLVKSIKNFIVSISNKAPDPEQDTAAVQEFLANMEGAFRVHSLWAGSSEEELESAGEGLEKYVMTKLYNRAFASVSEDVKQDEELFEKIALVQQFIRPENLDIKPNFQNETSWLLAQKELQKINMYKAPRDKLVCILNCCRVINNLLLNASISSDNPPGADEFLPVLIYVTIKANPPQLHSNLLYIQRYRRQTRLVSEAAYFFTNILSAESFISNIDAESLSMDELEFEHNMGLARAVFLGLSSTSETRGNQVSEEAMEKKSDTAPKTERDINDIVKEQDQLITKSLSVQDLEKQGASDLLKEEDLSKYFLEYPFLYAHSGDLTAGDVENLLNSYKQLVLKYVSLAKGMGINTMLNPTCTTIQEHAQPESNVESKESEEVVTTNDKYEDLTNENGTDSLYLGLDSSEPNIPADDSVLNVEKDEVLQ